MRRTLFLAAAVLCLSACRLDTAVDVTMQPDGSGTVAVTVTADQEIVQKAPDLANDLRFDDAVAAGWTVTGPVDTENGGIQVVLSRPFSTAEEASALLQSLSGTGGPLHDVTITRAASKEEITTSLAGTGRVDGGLDAFADPELLAAIGGSPFSDAITANGLNPTDVVTFTLTADLPGSAQSSGVGAPVNGSADALRWTVPMDGTALDLTSVFVQSQGRAASLWGTLASVSLGALVLWCVVALGFIAFVANARRQRAMRRQPPRYR